MHMNDLNIVTDASPPTLRPDISIVSTLYRSRPFLEDFLAECQQALKIIDARSHEIVLVNDGSPDDSLAYVLSRRSDIPELVVVDLSRNFGHHQAIQAGLRESQGALVFLIDCDLEVRPAVLAIFLPKMRQTGADVVFGFQESRKGHWFERFSGKIFWAGFNRLSDTQVKENLVTERIMTRRFVDALLRLGDHNLFGWHDELDRVHSGGSVRRQTATSWPQLIHLDASFAIDDQRRQFVFIKAAGVAFQHGPWHYFQQF